MYFRLIIYSFIIYLVYRVVVDLIIPGSKLASQVKDKMRDMEEQQRAQQRQQATHAEPKAPVTENKAGDYIDFEEIK
jgi:predicted Holliday junction resolvase-like endonuclease